MKTREQAEDKERSERQKMNRTWKAWIQGEKTKLQPERKKQKKDERLDVEKLAEQICLISFILLFMKHLKLYLFNKKKLQRNPLIIKFFLHPKKI